MTMFKTELLTLRDKLPRGLPQAVDEPVYDVMSDAFVWRDELIDFKHLSSSEVGALRALGRFRTSLITSIADTRFQDLWVNFKDLAPDWIGFATNRTKYSEKLADEYKSHKRKKGKP